MTYEADNLTPEQRAAAELLLGRPLRANQGISIQAFEEPDMSEEHRQEVLSRLDKLFAKANKDVGGASEDEIEEIYTEAMRTVRPTYEPLR